MQQHVRFLRHEKVNFTKRNKKKKKGFLTFDMLLCLMMNRYFIVSACREREREREEPLIQVQRTNEQERNGHRQLLSQPKREEVEERTNEDPHARTDMDQCGMRKNTTGQHTAVNYKSRMKSMYNMRRERNVNK